jgi:hypothetical protein
MDREWLPFAMQRIGNLLPSSLTLQPIWGHGGVSSWEAVNPLNGCHGWLFETSHLVLIFLVDISC